MRTDRGSALILMPTAVLILIVLGSLAVDLSLARLAQQDLAAIADAAANDATTVALDVESLRSGSTREHPYDLATACDVIRSSVVDNHNARYPVTNARISVDETTGAMRVELRGQVRHIFSPALDRVAESTVAAVGIAIPRRSAAPTAGHHFSTHVVCIS